MPSSTLYDTFGNEVKYKVSYDTLVAYIENSTINFPIPEASVDILGTLAENVTIDPVKLDTITTRLEKVGFKPAKAKTMAGVLIQVAQTQGVDPADYFEPGEAALKLAVDTYDTINMLRPAGNRVGLAKPTSNSKSRFGDYIKK